MNKKLGLLGISFALSFSSSASARLQEAAFEIMPITDYLMSLMYLMGFIVATFLFIKCGVFISSLERFNESSQNTSRVNEVLPNAQPDQIENRESVDSGSGVAVPIKDAKRKVIID